jgi:hypothetical protein
MKTKSFLLGFLLIVIVSFACKNPSGFNKPDDSLDAGREFIRAVLDGDYTKGELYILPNDEDIRLYKDYTSFMKKRTGKELIDLKQSNIIINKVEQISDSVTIINYYNSSVKKPVDIKLVYQNKEWWVDFSYTFSGNLPIVE